jgi:Na+/melibiose symporter-like transporter
VFQRADGTDSYTWLFVAVAVIMVAAVGVLMYTVKENRLAQETSAVNDAYDLREAAKLPPAERAAEEQAKKRAEAGLKSLSPEVRKSLMLILFSVSSGLWATTRDHRVHQIRDRAMGYDLSTASNFLMVATGAALLCYVPVGILSSRFGRKRMIQFGVALLTLNFAALGLFGSFSPLLYGLFVLVGVAWATINVNSYPMVVEISKSGDVGQYTGYYYTFSMAAQIVTPILSGYLMQYLGYRILAPYAAIMWPCRS